MKKSELIKNKLIQCIDELCKNKEGYCVNPNADFTDCEKCPAGTYASSNNQCKVCDRDQFLYECAPKCYDCPYGTYPSKIILLVLNVQQVLH